MSQTPSIESDCIECNGEVETLLNHIHERTFGRLHHLSVVYLADGRAHVSATAHSRFVAQLAEWAVFERLAPQDVLLSICVRHSSPSRPEVHK